MEHPTLIEAAFVNLLSASIPNTCQVLAGEDNLDKTGQRIVAYVQDLGEEMPPLSGNHETIVVVDLRTPFSKLSPKDIAGGTTEPLVVHQTIADQLQGLILSTTLPDQLTAAIPGFACFGLIDRQPFREQNEKYWLSGWRIKIYSCPTSFLN